VQLNKLYDPDDDLRSISIPEMGELAFNIVGRTIADEEVKRAHFIVRPNVVHIHWNHLLQQDKKVGGIKSGEEAMQKIMPSLLITTQKNNIELTIHDWMEKIKRLF